MKPIRRNDDRVWVKILYFYNDFYNLVLRLILGNLSNETIQSGNHLSDNNDSKLRANSSQAAWLLNIDRCFNLLNKIKLPKDFNIKNTRWVDVGCGNGLASIYVAFKYGFKSQLLFDFDERCIKYSKKKYITFNNSLFGSFKRIPFPTFMHIDASDDLLPNDFDGKNILYLYNPFDDVILKKFLLKNIELINKGSIIFYLNDIYRDVILETNELNLKDFKRNQFYEISVYIIG